MDDYRIDVPDIDLLCSAEEWFLPSELNIGREYQFLRENMILTKSKYLSEVCEFALNGKLERKNSVSQYKPVYIIFNTESKVYCKLDLPSMSNDQNANTYNKIVTKIFNEGGFDYFNKVIKDKIKKCNKGEKPLYELSYLSTMPVIENNDIKLKLEPIQKSWDRYGTPLTIFKLIDKKIGFCEPLTSGYVIFLGGGIKNEDMVNIYFHLKNLELWIFNKKGDVGWRDMVKIIKQPSIKFSIEFIRINKLITKRILFKFNRPVIPYHLFLYMEGKYLKKYENDIMMDNKNKKD
ncbi:hypothetical protein TBLA_0J01110 [Henningerozyma blattae CBS 6284]|uniref:Uncharacterized protein n=1 Tax=Henningerozyma blattae (strain ATCC 34711 / CBS 6284 / DSM 70876 / NBRC 10599 / NRRL Y-10934 / UCD 77-7) TaxID=1071380 RepID=I2H9Q7_HENB6|nr:hypothetical protein TBLA_0J01110 [Tetrapisispora blattae CBS 6284]CCH63109.1 hypothetical protein TBLA_0J01110 [Tetrapisispora blattae CBS 6284]